MPNRAFATFLLVLALYSAAFPIHAQEPPREPIMSVAWRPDGQVIAVGGIHGIWLYTADTFERLVYLEDSLLDTGGIRAIAWHPDGTRLVSARYDGVMRIWDAVNRERLATLRGHIGAVNGVAWSPEGTIIASAGDDLIVRTWEAATGRAVAALKKHRSRALCVAFSAYGIRLISGGADNAVLQWDIASGQSPATPQGHLGAVLDVAPAPDGEHYATASADRTVRLWRASGEALVTLRGHTDQVLAVGWRGALVLSAGRDGTLRAWDPASLSAPVALLEGYTIRSAAFSPDGRRVLLVTGEYAAQIVDTTSGAVLATLQR